MIISRLGMAVSTLAALAFAAPAFAATEALTPTTVSVTEGQTVSLTISVDAQTDKLVTVKDELSYPTDLLQPVSFTLAPTWIALSQPGYDQMSGGTVIKTAGYPSGFTGSKEFGTIVFKAVKSGSATISSSNSVAYSTQGKIAFSSAGASTVTIASNTPPPTQKTPPTTTTTTKPKTQPKPVVTSTPTTTATTTVAATATTTSTSTEVAAAALATSQTSLAWLWWLIGIIVVLGAGWGAFKFFRRS